MPITLKDTCAFLCNGGAVYGFCLLSAFVTDAGSIVLQMPRNRKRVTQKEKEIIEAYALSQNASYFETVARVILCLNL